MKPMKRIAILSAALTVLVGLDGVYMMATHYKPKDVNSFNLSDGGTLMVAAGLLLLVTVVSFLMAKKPDEADKGV
ncbi:hypothetical protein CEB3_c28090 [Peptococcaceae bacterium CEB3]|nr:hypothetical protein CEB3_c28090 [Peptococcaceae bacterium CEB3]